MVAYYNTSLQCQDHQYLDLKKTPNLFSKSLGDLVNLEVTLNAFHSLWLNQSKRKKKDSIFNNFVLDKEGL